MKVPRSGRAHAGSTSSRLTTSFVIALASLGALSACDFHEVTAPGSIFTLEVIPDSVTLPVNGTQRFIALGRDADGIEVEVSPTWSVVNGGGTIDPSGDFTAGPTPGTYSGTVQATSGGISATATVTVVVGALASITVSPHPDTLAVGGLQQFTAVGRDVAGNVVPITPTWSSDNGGGIISGSGQFTAGNTPGTYSNTVTATSGGVSGDATVVVIAGPLASIAVTPNPDTTAVTLTQQFTAVGRDAGGNVVPITPAWSVVNGGGDINGSGLFTAGTSPGSFANTVVATSGGISGNATVVVIAGALASITVMPNPDTTAVNQTQQFTAVGRDAVGNVVPISPAWSTVNGGGGIDGSGLFTAGATPGTFSNTVRAASGGVSGLATVVVTAGPLASITVTPDPVALLIDATQQFTAVGRDAAGNVVPISPVWSVVNGGGTITASGLFTAGPTPGDYANTVQATSGGLSGNATVTVLAGALATITVTPDPVTLPVNADQQFTAVGRDASGNIVAISPTWSVQNSGGAINGSGLFTAGTSPGTFANTVVATSGSISGDATVTVTPGPLASITVTPNPDTTGVNQTQQFTAVGRDAEGNVIPIVTAWSVVNGGGIINGSGLFSAANAAGTFTNTVRATSGGVSGFATVVVTAPPPPPSTFRVLANSSVACTGGSIAGDVGTFSAAGVISGCNISGGTAQTGTAAAVTAFNNSVAAYQARETIACGTTLTGTLAGVSLAPGVYCFDSAATLTGTLTLNGPSNGVWLIKVGTTGIGALTGTNFDVVMAGGGQACNVTWWVEDATTMTDSTLKGLVLSEGDITTTNGTLDGNIWSQGNVAVTGTVLTDCAP